MKPKEVGEPVHTVTVSVVFQIRARNEEEARDRMRFLIDMDWESESEAGAGMIQHTAPPPWLTGISIPDCADSSIGVNESDEPAELDDEEDDDTLNRMCGAPISLFPEAEDDGAGATWDEEE